MDISRVLEWWFDLTVGKVVPSFQCCLFHYLCLRVLCDVLLRFMSGVFFLYDNSDSEYHVNPLWATLCPWLAYFAIIANRNPNPNPRHT